MSNATDRHLTLVNLANHQVFTGKSVTNEIIFTVLGCVLLCIILLYIALLYLIIGPDYDCVPKIVDSIENGERSCGCNLECQSTEYAKTLSSSKWPSSIYLVRVN